MMGIGIVVYIICVQIYVKDDMVIVCFVGGVVIIGVWSSILGEDNYWCVLFMDLRILVSGPRYWYMTIIGV